MRHFLHALKWILLTALAIPLTLYCILLLINIRDVAPSEQSKYYLAQIEETDRTLANNLNDNAYIFALGFGAPKGELPMTTGLDQLQKLQNKDVSSIEITTPAKYYTPPKLPLKSCLGEDDFLATCKANIKQSSDLKTLLSNNRWLIERYQQLLNMSTWQDNPNFNNFMKALPFQNLLIAQKLYLLEIYENIDSSSPKLTAQAIEQDMLFWQRLSLNTYILSNKMVSAGAMSVNMKLGEVILNQQKLEQDAVQIPTSWTKSVPANVLSLSNVKLGEWLYFTRITKTTQVDDGSDDTITKIATSLLHPLMQNQDTANRYAEYLVGPKSQTECLSSVSIDTISSYIYNPIGKYILCTGVPSFNAYQLNLDKLERQRANLMGRLER
ncbi:hypothetical protein JK628_19840 [Shewanella sp. KX20019]|uniref:hypothetical protein n=1 Tax=Shewanella sp. KX20019 TaxID=2803864 RepID=UPI00192833AD|nr:hypothetical protein [Shewanella sp. KX20019]QQX79734.1 hypothetical protein JK628_19840 [Shewanella sp. KX20019]